MGKRVYGKNEIECFYSKKEGHSVVNFKLCANDLPKGKIKELVNIVGSC